MKNITYYTKIGIIAVAIFVESFLLVTLINSYVYNQTYFSFSSEPLVMMLVLMLTLMLTVALTAGVWDKYEQIFVISLSVSFCVGLATLEKDLMLSVVSFIISTLLLINSVISSTQIKEMFIKFVPTKVFESINKMLMLIFSLFGGIVVMVSYANPQAFDLLNKRIEEMVTTIYDNAISPTISKQLGLDSQSEESLFQNIDMLKQEYGLELNIDKKVVQENIKTTNDSIKEAALLKIKSFIEPYKAVVPIVLALLVFSTLQFVFLISYYIYLPLVRLVFYLAKKAGFIKMNYIDVKKEVIKF